MEGELAEKVELFKKTEEELNNDVVDAYDEGFQDAMAQFACVHPEVDLSPFDESKCVVCGQLVLREQPSCNLVFLVARALYLCIYL